MKPSESFPESCWSAAPAFPSQKPSSSSVKAKWPSKLSATKKAASPSLNFPPAHGNSRLPLRSMSASPPRKPFPQGNVRRAAIIFRRKPMVPSKPPCTVPKTNAKSLKSTFNKKKFALFPAHRATLSKSSLTCRASQECLSAWACWSCAAPTPVSVVLSARHRRDR